MCSLQTILRVKDMVQVTELFPKATLSPSAVVVQLFVEKFSMTPGCLSPLGQKTPLFLGQEKLNMKSIYLGKLHLVFEEFTFGA